MTRRRIHEHRHPTRTTPKVYHTVQEFEDLTRQHADEPLDEFVLRLDGGGSDDLGERRLSGLRAFTWLLDQSTARGSAVWVSRRSDGLYRIHPDRQGYTGDQIKLFDQTPFFTVTTAAPFLLDQIQKARGYYIYREACRRGLISP